MFKVFNVAVLCWLVVDDKIHNFVFAKKSKVQKNTRIELFCFSMIQAVQEAVSGS